jgi:hypothetical protein
MTEVHNFLLRRARLKRASDAWHKADASGEKPLESAEIVAAGAGAAATLPRIDAAAVEPFDMASLPSIDAIAVDTDVRRFLHSGVPAELTRAALRRAWMSEPAIRDFVGIAEPMGFQRSECDTRLLSAAGDRECAGCSHPGGAWHARRTRRDDLRCAGVRGPVVAGRNWSRAGRSRSESQPDV